MIKYLILLNLLISISCSNSENDYEDFTSSKEDIHYYELNEVQFQDGHQLTGYISIPRFLEEVKPIEDNIIFQAEYFEDNSGYMVSIHKLKSRNTEQLSDKKYADITNEHFKNEMKGDLSEVERILSPTMKNVRVIELRGNLIINHKYFSKRVSYYLDKRHKGTAWEEVNCINFHFVTIQNKTKYSFNINYYGDDKSVSNVVGEFNTIGGSIKFK